MYDQSGKDKRGNAIIGGEVFTYESRGNIINLPSGKVAVIQGLKDYVIVQSDDVLLIVKKEDEQNIKHYLEDVKNSTGEKYQ